MRESTRQSRDKFITAAIDEMQAHGISDFSIRRVAEKCGVSSLSVGFVPNSDHENRDKRVNTALFA